MFCLLIKSLLRVFYKEINVCYVAFIIISHFIERSCSSKFITFKDFVVDM